jgi:hypothetical protein
MEDALITATKFYTVRPNSQIFLRVDVGDSQVGGTTLQLNGTTIASTPTGETTIGAPGQDLRRSVLQVITTVKDQNPQTNRTSVVHRFRGGESDMTFPLEVSVRADGGVARYFITYVLA